MTRLSKLRYARYPFKMPNSDTYEMPKWINDYKYGCVPYTYSKLSKAHELW